MMKRFLLRFVSLFFIIVGFFVTIYLYRMDKITFFPITNKKQPSLSAPPTIYDGQRYKLSYSDKPELLSLDLFHFEEGEECYGDGELDFYDFFEGESSLSMKSFNRSKTVMACNLKEGFKMTDFSYFKLLTNIRTSPSNIEELNIIFTDKESKNIYKYQIMSLNKSWELVTIPQEKFVPVKKENGTPVIRKMIIELASRPKTISIVNFDFFWAEGQENYMEDWNTNSTNILSLGKDKELNSTSLLMVGLAEHVATLKKVGRAENYKIRAKFIPLKGGNFGFFLNGNYINSEGYYFLIEGIESGGWKIQKNGNFNGQRKILDLGKGFIKNFEIEKDRSYWLKAEVNKRKLSFYFSINGVDYIKLGEIVDQSFPFGEVGITISGGAMIIVDDIEVSG